MQGVFEFKDLSLQYGSTAGISIEFHRELPGATLALATTLTMGSTGGATTRMTATRPLDGYYGKLFKVKVTSTGVFTLFSGHVQVRPIGTYVDGANNEIWETQPISLGV